MSQQQSLKQQLLSMNDKSVRIRNKQYLNRATKKFINQTFLEMERRKTNEKEKAKEVRRKKKGKDLKSVVE